MLNSTDRRDGKMAVYLNGVINGKVIDTGSGMNLMPASEVEGVTLEPVKQRVSATNGSNVNFTGKV